VSVHITSLDDLGKFNWNIFARVTSDIATGGGAELLWNKKSRKAITKGVKKVGKAAKKVGEKVLCPVADNFKKGPTAEAAMKSGGYGTAAVIAASAVSSLCPKTKEAKKAAKDAQAATGEFHWYHNPLAVGAAGVGFGLLLGVLFSLRSR
jgi:hypothetical protein